MRWAEISLQVAPEYVDPASAVLMAAGCSGVVVTDPQAVSSDPYAEWVVRDQNAAPSAPEPCIVSGYLPVDDRLEAALADVKARLHVLQESGLSVSDELRLKTVDDEAWADAWKAYFKPLRVGRHFVIKPSWEGWDAAPGDRVIEIDPGMAFGSGSHPTTQLCLRLLEDVVRPGMRVLDWGTGSGILAIGAARLGTHEVVAVDLDPLAARVAGENAALNGYGRVISTSAGSIEKVPLDPPFDLVVANIVADPIIAGAPEVRRHLRDGGQAIVSGIIDRREAEVTSALEAAGLRLERVERDQEWRALLLAATTPAE